MFHHAETLMKPLKQFRETIPPIMAFEQGISWCFMFHVSRFMPEMLFYAVSRA